MHYFPLSDINIFQIEIFLAAAKELSYTRAAKACNTSQPTVSRQISALEETLGIILFVKRGGNLQLTPAGKKLQTVFEDTLSKLRTGIQSAFTIQEGFQSGLSVTIPYTADPFAHFYRLKHSYAQRMKSPNFKIEYFIKNGDAALEQLLNYGTDLVITTTAFKELYERCDEVNLHTISKEPLSALMMRTNPLSSRHSITFQELKDQKILLPQEPMEKSYVDMVIGYFRKANITPSISSYGDVFMECLLRLEKNDEVIILNELSKNYDSSLHTCVPIEGTEAGYYIAWRKSDDADLHIRQFVDYSEEYFFHYHNLNARDV